MTCRTDLMMSEMSVSIPDTEPMSTENCSPLCNMYVVQWAQFKDWKIQNRMEQNYLFNLLLCM